eukprot:403374827
MSKKPGGQKKEDILAFLDSKFSKFDNKKQEKDKKKRDEKFQSKPKNVQEINSVITNNQQQEIKTTVNKFNQKNIKNQQNNIKTNQQSQKEKLNQSISNEQQVDILKIKNQSLAQSTSLQTQNTQTLLASTQSQSQLSIQNQNQLQQALHQTQQHNPLLRDDLLYKPLNQSQSQAQINKDLQQFKDFSLKNPKNYDQDLKTKIFFIGQNNLGSIQSENTGGAGMGSDQQSLKQKQQQRQQMVQAQRHVSKNTLKQLDKLQQVQQAELKYDTFVNLNKLWCQYIMTLLGRDENMASVCAKIVKADLNGACLTVVKSKNPCMIGVSGIVVRESVRCLFIINEKNEVKNLLKSGSVFEIDLKDGERFVRIWGDNILFMGSERTKVKFKEKFALELY